MQTIKISGGKVIAEGITETSVYIKDGSIFAVTDQPLDYDIAIDATGLYVSPGFIDVHVHGGGGHDFMDGDEQGTIRALQVHMRHGTTSILPTTLTAQLEDTQNAIETIKAVQNAAHIPHILGVHIEGPYISPQQCGAQDAAYIGKPVRREYENMIAQGEGIIKKWTFAPELAGSDAFCAYLMQQQIVPSIGHTDATFADVRKAYEAGVTNMTHLYSSMSALHRINGYRILGAVEAAYILDDMCVEVISDGAHLPPELLQMIYKCKGSDKICLVTDAMRGADMPDGESVLGNLRNGQKCIIEDGIAKMPDRSGFAGSVATMDRQVRTFYKSAGVDLASCVKMATQTPARTLGLHNKGKIAQGMDADILLFDDDIRIQKILVKQHKQVNIYDTERMYKDGTENL